MDQKIATGIIGAVMLLAGLGGGQLLSQDQFENAYVCNATEELGLFYGGLSSTHRTGYPSPDTYKGKKLCGGFGESAVWVSLSEYAKARGVSPSTFLLSSKKGTPKRPGYKRELCFINNSCVPLPR